MKMNMKKIISWGVMLAAAFTLTNCAKEIDAPVQEPESAGIPFEIVASTVDTKTVNDGMSTKWAVGDQINVFHALGELTVYVDDGAFTVSDVEKGVFTGTINPDVEFDVEEEYDWYLLYPYNKKVTTPGAQTAGYTYIGYSSGLDQNGYNSMASLKGSVCPLYGTAKYAGVRPEITMNHLSSIIAINVTNQNEEPLTITTASFTAPEDIVGSYFIDITGESVVYTPSAANYVKKEAIVNVSGGTALAKGESAILYAAIKPFTAAAGQKLTLSVNGYSKDITIPNDKNVTFTAGKIKTLNFAYDKEQTPAEEGVTSASLVFDSGKTNRVSQSATEQVWQQNGIKFTNTKASSTTNVGDYANPVRLYKNSKITIEAPGYITKIIYNSAANSGDNTYKDWLISNVGDCTIDGNYVSVDYSGTSNMITCNLSAGQVRLYDITVYYSTEGYVPPTLESISVDDYISEFTKGDSFSFGGTVSAHYDNGAIEDVTAEAEFSGYDMGVTGKQTVTVTYEDATTTYEITVNEPQADAKSWKLVTDASTLKAGDVIRLGCSSKKVAAGAMGSQKYFTSVSATYANGVMTSATAIDIKLGGSAGQWTMTTSEGTISTSAAKALKKDGSGTKTWTISITSSGAATIKSTTTSYGWIQYNASSPRFLNYASNQTAIEIYRYE